jgi:serine/threonine protein kinase/Flp pilus assembly protein TadD
LVHAELECRLKAGEPARVEEYLRRYPALGDVRETVLALVVAEYEFRHRREPALDPAEYDRRFPSLAGELTQRLRLAAADEGAPSTLTGTRPAGEPASEPASAGAAGRYQLGRLHARGGLGEVLVARDDELQREVALKRLQSTWADNRDSRRRFLREARITARLQHPGIVPVYGLVTDANGRPCYAMRLVEGASLKEALSQFHKADLPDRDPSERSLALRELLTRFVAVCNTVAYAHSRGIIHRDLKPSNILLGAYGETLVVDWGLAKPWAAAEGGDADDDTRTPDLAGPLPEGATRMGEALGTPAYMSPEQAAGRWDLVGPASDVYSLGATLYHVLTGRVPFANRNLEAALVQVQRAEFPPPRQVKPAVAPALEAICLKAMAPQAEARYAGALELAADVERFLADEPVTAYREPLLPRLRRWGRRHRTAVLVAAVTLPFFLAGGVGGLFLWEKAEEERHENLAARRTSAEASEEVALAELHADHFASAAGLLRQAAAGLEGEPELAALRSRLEARRDRAERLAGFYESTDQAERLEAEQSTRADNFADSGAAAVGERGLARLDVFEPGEWWNRLPDDDLTQAQRDRLREDVYHQLLLLAGVRAKRGLGKGWGLETEAAFRAALQAADAANRFRPESYAGRRMEAFAHLVLVEPGQIRRNVVQEPNSATDYYVSGLLHLGVAIVTDPSEDRGGFERALMGTARLVVPLDYKTPLATAERHFRMATAREPRHYWSHCWLGLTLSKAGKKEAAELAWGACVALRPDYPTAYCFRADALQQRGLRTTDPLARQRLLDQAFADADTAVRLDPSSYMARRARVDCLLGQGKYAQALPDCDAAIHLEPKVAGALIDRGVCYQHLGKPEQALADFDQAVTLAPRDPDAYRARGNLHASRGEFERALKDLDRAVGLQPNDTRLLEDRAAAYAHLGQWKSALTDWVKIRELRPNDARVGQWVAALQLQTGDADGYRQTCADLLKRFSATRDAGTAETVVRACVLAPDALPEPARAVDLAERATRADAGRPTCRVARGAALYRAGKWDEAAGALRGATDPLGRLFLVMSEARLGHADQARACWDEATAARGKDVPASADPIEQLPVRIVGAEAATLVKSPRRLGGN